MTRIKSSEAGEVDRNREQVQLDES